MHYCNNAHNILDDQLFCHYNQHYEKHNTQFI